MYAPTMEARISDWGDRRERDIREDAYGHTFIGDKTPVVRNEHVWKDTMDMSADLLPSLGRPEYPNHGYTRALWRWLG